MNLSSRRPIFNRKPESNVYRMFFWVVLTLGGVWLLLQIRQGHIKPLFLPTPTPTRNSQSFALEGDAQFTAGNMDGAISAYKAGVQVDPTNADLWAKLARIQTYSSALLVSPPDQKARLGDALQSADQAVKLAPDNSTAYAVRAFTLDWNANPGLVDDNAVEADLTQAEQDAVRALQLDNTNTLALAFYAEILVDQQKWTQGEQYIKQALDRDPSLMDVHRVYAYVLESLGQYNLAIQEYDKAIAISPNLTFLYLRAGANYRRLGFASPNQQTQSQLYESSLEYFAKAARIDAALGIKDPIPYLSIAKTYSQEGEYFIAARNVQKALAFQPDNPDLYGQLGIIYQKSRNYEGAIPTLKCAIKGCAGADSCIGRGLDGCDAQDPPVQVTGLPLSPSTVVYYYTYGSLVAALSRPDANNCPDALGVLGEVNTQYGSDPTIAGIVQAGQAICQSLGTSGSLPAASTATSIFYATPIIITSTPNATAVPTGTP
jgi:tetratricopeptide (TPR) repeat protein